MKKEISIKEFGAAGDGKTDDTAAIQAAFDSSYDVKLFQRVYTALQRP